MMELYLKRGKKIDIESTCKGSKPKHALFLVITLSIGFTSIFSLVPPTANGKISADNLSGDQSTTTVPQIKMIYDNKVYDMSTFVLADSGQMKKITIPQGDLPDDGSNPPIPLQIGSTVHFQFDKQPTKVNAYLIDTEAQPVELYSQRQIGPTDFQILGPRGILNFEVHAFFPDGQYISRYVLAEVMSGANPTVTNFTDNQAGSNNNSPDNGYIGLSDKLQCKRPDRLPILQITSNSPQYNKTSSITTVLNDNNLQTAWILRGTSVKAFVKSSLENTANPTESSDKNAWIQLDLGADKTVCNIGIAFPNGDKTVYFFKVQTSTDGKHFTDVGTAETYPLVAGGQLFTFPDTPEKARYIRISDVGDLVSGATEISELVAAGK
jgi:F5/8 type C domain